MSSHSRKPRNYHDLEKQIIGNNYQKLSHIRDIVTGIMDDLYEAKELPVGSLNPNETFFPMDFDEPND